LDFPGSLSYKKPIVTAGRDADGIAVFETFTTSISHLSARLEIKIDIVRRMPPRSPAPKTFCQFRSSGRRQIPTETAIKLNRGLITEIELEKAKCNNKKTEVKDPRRKSKNIGGGVNE
jgi:hypothetical protein